MYQLPKNEKKEFYGFEKIECMNGSNETTTSVGDPTSPSPLTTTHLLTDF